MRLHALALPLLVLAQTTGATRTIDIIAIDANGAPAAALQPADLMVRIDGRVHPVLDLRTMPADAGRGSSRASADTLPAPYASNQIPGGSDVSVAIDVTRLESADLPKVREGINTVLGVSATFSITW